MDTQLRVQCPVGGSGRADTGFHETVWWLPKHFLMVQFVFAKQAFLAENCTCSYWSIYVFIEFYMVWGAFTRTFSSFYLRKKYLVFSWNWSSKFQPLMPSKNIETFSLPFWKWFSVPKNQISHLRSALVSECAIMFWKTSIPLLNCRRLRERLNRWAFIDIFLTKFLVKHDGVTSFSQSWTLSSKNLSYFRQQPGRQFISFLLTRIWMSPNVGLQPVAVLRINRIVRTSSWLFWMSSLGKFRS